MEGASLRKILQGLCHDLHWDYAVFWKLQHGDQTHLKWEEGYYVHPTLLESKESILADMGFNVSDPLLSSSWGSGGYDGCPYKFPVGLSEDDRASVRYHWGEGVVGEVAYTGCYSWVLCQDLFSRDFESNVIPLCPDEWLLQFEAGIKTIVLIPVSQHGVLQLGSSKKVSDDPSMVALVKDKLNSHFNYLCMDDMNKLSTRICQMKTEYPGAVLSAKKMTVKSSCTNQMMPLQLAGDACNVSGENKLEILKIIRKDDNRFQSVSLSGVPPLDNFMESEIFESTMTGSSINEEDFKSLSCSGYNLGIFDEHVCVETKMVEPHMDSYTDHRADMDTLFSFPMDCELHKALGPAFQRHSKGYPWDPLVAYEDSQSSSSELLNRDLEHATAPSSWESSGCLVNRDDGEHLLEAVFATTDSSFNGNLCKEADKSVLQSQSEETVFVKKKGVSGSSVTIDRDTIKSPPLFSSESMLSTLIHEELQKEECSHPQNKKWSKASNSSKKRARPGESPRPRPRDRQLIQDRIKELRGLVPNGSKCSIDGLLNKTIKHMLFLRDVTERAGKLRHWVNQEVTGQRKMRLSSMKSSSQNGASWAFELGSDFQMCPIFVKDLEHPGHMLIEMVCNDHGLFLEIAEVIRRLGLTILKGEMEGRANNTWADFIIEVSEGFQRLDIFWPLMQLLQKGQAPIRG